MTRIIKEGSEGYDPIRASFGTVWKDNTEGVHLYIKTAEPGNVRMVKNEERLRWDTEIYTLASIDTEKGVIIFKAKE